MVYIWLCREEWYGRAIRYLFGGRHEKQAIK